jgi:hypothetical protein
VPTETAEAVDGKEAKVFDQRTDGKNAAEDSVEPILGEIESG